jgi:hypothetical protein
MAGSGQSLAAAGKECHQLLERHGDEVHVRVVLDPELQHGANLVAEHLGGEVDAESSGRSGVPGRDERGGDGARIDDREKIGPKVRVVDSDAVVVRAAEKGTGTEAEIQARGAAEAASQAMP